MHFASWQTHPAFLAVFFVVFHAALIHAQTAIEPPSVTQDPTFTPEVPTHTNPVVTATRPKAKSKKGLQVEDVDDAIALGVQHAAFNLSLSSLLRSEGQPQDLPVHIEGTKYFINHDYLEYQDRQIKALSDSGALIYLIVLAYQSPDPRINELLIHPNYHPEAPNRIGAFNTASDHGQAAFGTLMSFIVQRWSSPSSTQGQVHGYIIGNEVNSHWYWYNQDECSPAAIIQSYGEAIRIASAATRKHSPFAKTFISLDHYWTLSHTPQNPQRSMGSEEFLRLFSDWSTSHGDFEWHLAFHPYPENLFDPRFWEDTTATAEFNSPRVTFKNLDMLQRWMEQAEYQHHGRKRRIILSEQGFHSSNQPNRERGELIQAAAYCYAYKIVEQLNGIDAFILHRHIDHPHEGGLNLGLLRRGPEPLSARRKKVYDCFKQADSLEWESAFEFALPIIGKQSWSDIP